MKAAYIEETGPPSVIKIGELPTPEPGEREVLVRVHAASVNPVDTYIRSGMITMPLPKPYILGCDLAGVVEKTGPGCRKFKPGDRVWGSNQGLLGRQGTFAEYAAVHEDWLYPIPENVSFEEAAAAALVGITAHLGLFRCAGLRSGEVLYVNGGTGGVGSMVVQMGKIAGAKVITTVGNEEKAAICRRWGADLVLNYKTDDIETEVLRFTDQQGVHVWYETQREPLFDRIVKCTRLRGRIVIMAGREARPPFPVGPFYVKDLTMYGFAMFNASPEEQRICAEDINHWLSQKKLEVLIGKVFPLEEAAAAHQLQEENTLRKAGTLRGKIVIKIR